MTGDKPKEIRLLPRQQVAMACPAFELLFGGQKGGGKSHFLTLCPVPLLNAAHRRFVQTGQRQPQCRVVIFRKNLRDLKDIIVKAQQYYPLIDPGAEWNKVEKTWTFTSGATVELAHLDGPDDHMGYNGQELIMVLFDEVPEISYDAYSFIVAQVRTSDDYYRPYLQVRSTANPGGKHGAWVKKRFIDPHPEGNKIIVEEGVTRAFIPAALKDNPYLAKDGEYEKRLRATLAPHQIKMYLEGDWNVVVGAMFAHLVRDGVHIVDSFPIPGTWEMRGGLDWGSTNDAACVWGARDDDGDIVIIDEMTMPGRTGRWFGEQMRKKLARQEWSAERRWGPEDFYYLIDHQATGSIGAEGAAAAHGIASWGFRLFNANKDREAGIEQIKERMLIRASGRPRLRIFRDRCPRLVEALSGIPADKKNLDDYDRDSPFAHLVDALRFLLMDFPVYHGEPTDQQQRHQDQWERYFQRRREVAPSHRDDYTGY